MMIDRPDDTPPPPAGRRASIGDDSWPEGLSENDLNRYGFYGGMLDAVDQHRQATGNPPTDDELVGMARSMADFHGIPLREALGLDAASTPDTGPFPVQLPAMDPTSPAAGDGTATLPGIGPRQGGDGTHHAATAGGFTRSTESGTPVRVIFAGDRDPMVLAPEDTTGRAAPSRPR